MAYTPRKNSIWGRAFGLRRGPTPRVYATYGLEAKGLFLSTAADGTFVQEHIEGFTSVESASTGTAALSIRGITIMTTGASTGYTLAAPQATGIRKSFISVSTAARQVTSAAHMVRGVSGSLSAGDSGIITASTAHTLLTFGGIGQSIELVSLSTAAWAVTSVSGFSSLATPVTTV